MSHENFDASRNTMLLSFLFGLIVLFCDDVRTQTTQFCDVVQYTFINSTNRSAAFISTQPYTCDRGVIKNDHWYRFYSLAGNTMPTANPGLRRCGTYVPIWFQGTHPTTENIVAEAKACAPVPFTFPVGCGVSYDIKVVKCPGDFYVYRLKEPMQCSLAYCAGKITIIE